jgi:hypothetical protein
MVRLYSYTAYMAETKYCTFFCSNQFILIDLLYYSLNERLLRLKNVFLYVNIFKLKT